MEPSTFTLEILPRYPEAEAGPLLDVTVYRKVRLGGRARGRSAGGRWFRVTVACRRRRRKP